MNVWRVGHRSAPCNFTPRHFYGWVNRFDDPHREYRTLYCCDFKLTCLREVLADFRPNLKAIREFGKTFKKEPSHFFGTVPMEWRRAHVLIECQLKIIKGAIVDLAHGAIKKDLKKQLKDFLKEQKIRVLNMKELRSKNRMLTQKISRALFEDGYAVIKFTSHLDRQPCYALFEARAELHPTKTKILLSENFKEFQQVCNEFGLEITTV